MNFAGWLGWAEVEAEAERKYVYQEEVVTLFFEMGWVVLEIDFAFFWRLEGQKWMWM